MARELGKKPGALFDQEGVFHQDYLYFYEPILTPEFNAQQSDVISGLLSLKRGESVLDLGCGHGRISNELAKRGLNVTGLDASPFFLDVARDAARQSGAKVEYVEGDMRNFPWVEKFNAIYCWYTTYGYFSDDDNVEVLRQSLKALKPGGRLLVEQTHRNALLRRDMPLTDYTNRGEDLMIDKIDYDVFKERTHTERFIVRGGSVRKASFSIRLYSFVELSDRLSDVGFSSVEGFGRGGEPLTAHNPRLIVVARK